MKTRAITGFFFIMVMLGSFLLGNHVFAAFYLALSCFCLYEFYSLIKKDTATPNIPAGILSGAILYCAFALLNHAGMFGQPALKGLHLAYGLLFIFVLSIGLVFIRELFKISVAPFANIAYTLMGMAFVIMPFTFFHALAYINHDYNFHIPMAFLLMLWSNDTGAYLVGMSIGRTKLFERHSPKKTWEGFIGGVVISAGVGNIISLYYPELSWKHWVSVGILISCFGTLGDLVESMFKRSINIKDSGTILPGHGGLLDRFDGLLLAAPVVYTYLYFALNF
ncbi:phosphatidate cytidylyltransferase [Mucilaginibacter sp. AK015]|uniref:phosphatidate cytidylyltransferase n=1 Tax=Mucilaginibacter sp. AK015 TaxID=2723072 RepID=UPI00160F3F4E|nr:phosphatidate cytidylyltransferase [Mucilaginibacter sp. AK015]MBB5397408.1 phosphatidate cytidylyltransferase [Mucilaginibacter sp. AK015]